MELGDLANFLAIVATVFGFLGGGWAAWNKYVSWKFNKDAEQLCFRLRNEAGPNVAGFIWQFEPGSRNFELAEHLVAKGKMVRRVMGGYGFYSSSFDRGFGN